MGKKHPFLTIGVPVIVAFVVTWALMSFPFYRIEAQFYDWRFILKPQKKADDRIVLIPVRKNYSFSDHSRVFDLIAAQKPLAVVYLMSFDRTQARQEKADLENLYLRMQSSMDNKETSVFFGTDIDVSAEEILPPEPLDRLPHASAIIHKDGSIFAQDKVTRRALTYVENEPTLHVLLAELAHNRKYVSHEFKGTQKFEEINTSYVFINYPGDTSSSMGIFHEVEFKRLLDADVSDDLFRGRIVLVSSILEDNSSDFAYTPFSRKILDNPKLYVHASILDTLIKDNGITMLGDVWDFLLTFLLSSLMTFLALRTPPAKGIVFMLCATVALMIMAFMVFGIFGVSINCIHPLLGIFFAYYIFVPYRAITENRIRFLFQKKHEVLQQVDEYKNNFLSFISHDLKTPVARIQGLADLLLDHDDIPVVERRSHLEEISRSTQELNQFISSILNLAKIEANRVKLNKTSKDMNRIVEEVLVTASFNASKKKIRIEKNLEPLFPIRIDVTLMTQVVGNLVENAIKYSNEGTTVSVGTRENDGWVVLEIRDQGWGMDEEDVSNAFTKFYRGKNSRESSVKGSGLGLYLVKYFIDLHKGAISLESSPGKGTTFTVRLPLEDENV